MSLTPRQMLLSLEYRPALGRADFLISPANQVAAATVAEWQDWPGRRTALVGPPRAGKTHLAHVWMQQSGARLIAATALEPAGAEALVTHGRAVIEDVDRIADLSPKPRAAAERGLFHLMNLAAAEGAWLLLTGREAPARWQVETPDLASRLAALPVASLAAPDDMLLSSLMVKLFADRGIEVAPDVIGYLAQRIERSCAAAEAAVEALDRLSLTQKRAVTKPLVAAYLRNAATEDGAQG